MSPRPARPRRLQGRELPNITDEVGDLIPWGDRRTYKPSKEGNRFLGLCANPFWPFGAPVQRQLLYHFGTRRLTPWTPPNPSLVRIFLQGQRSAGKWPNCHCFPVKEGSSQFLRLQNPLPNKHTRTLSPPLPVGWFFWLDGFCRYCASIQRGLSL